MHHCCVRAGRQIEERILGPLTSVPDPNFVAANGEGLEPSSWATDRHERESTALRAPKYGEADLYVRSRRRIAAPERRDCVVVTISVEITRVGYPCTATTGVGAEHDPIVSSSENRDLCVKRVSATLFRILQTIFRKPQRVRAFRPLFGRSYACDAIALSQPRQRRQRRVGACNDGKKQCSGKNDAKRDPRTRRRQGPHLPHGHRPSGIVGFILLGFTCPQCVRTVLVLFSSAAS